MSYPNVLLSRAGKCPWPRALFRSERGLTFAWPRTPLFLFTKHQISFFFLFFFSFFLFFFLLFFIYFKGPPLWQNWFLIQPKNSSQSAIFPQSNASKKSSTMIRGVPWTSPVLFIFKWGSND